MNRHYRSVLDEPVPALGDETPRAAIKTESGRGRPMAQNDGKPDGDFRRSEQPDGKYNFGWLWEELGLSELRR
jgi:hypothetical protein